MITIDPIDPEVHNKNVANHYLNELVNLVPQEVQSTWIGGDYKPDMAIKWLRLLVEEWKERQLND